MDKKSHLVQSHTDGWQRITPLALCPLAFRPPTHPYIVTTVTIPKWKGEKTVLQGAKDWFKITPFPFLILFYPSPSVHPSHWTILTTSHPQNSDAFKKLLISFPLPLPFFFFFFLPVPQLPGPPFPPIYPSLPHPLLRKRDKSGCILIVFKGGTMCLAYSLFPWQPAQDP